MDEEQEPICNCGCGETKSYVVEHFMKYLKFSEEEAVEHWELIQYENEKALRGRNDGRQD